MRPACRATAKKTPHCLPLYFLPSSPSLLSSPGRVTCQSGEEEDGVLQLQPIGEEDQQRRRLYPLHGGSATAVTLLNKTQLALNIECELLAQKVFRQITGSAGLIQRRALLREPDMTA